MSTKSFTDLGVAEPLTAALARRSITIPFAIQSLVVPDALAGRDVLAKSPTGSGKTLAFAIPITQRLNPGAARPSALVLVPTRELAVQVAEEFEDLGRAHGLRVTAVYGGTSVSGQGKAAKSAHILVATPGRLEDLARRKLVKLDGIEILVLDEADRMLDMGFQPQVDAIVKRLPRKRQTMFFSATLDGEIAELARAYTDNPSRFDGELPGHLERGDTEHRFVGVTDRNKVEPSSRCSGTTTGSRSSSCAPSAAQTGSSGGFRARRQGVGDHGDMNQRSRERALAAFEAGKVTTLVANRRRGRGLDLDEITHVINYDPPADSKGTPTGSDGPPAQAATVRASPSSSRSSRRRSVTLPGASAARSSSRSRGCASRRSAWCTRAVAVAPLELAAEAAQDLVGGFGAIPAVPPGCAARPPGLRPQSRPYRRDTDAPCVLA